MRTMTLVPGGIPGTPARDDVELILRRQAAMEMERTNFDSLWADVAAHALPRQADFPPQGTSVQGSRRSGRIMDETALLALDRGIAAFEGYVMPRGQRWQNLEPRDDELAKLRHVREWFERKTAQLFGLRSAPSSGFENQAHESVASLLAFGTQGMTPEIRRDALGRPMGLAYRSEHLGSLYVMENAWGRIDVTHRKFRLTAHQACQMWPHGLLERARKELRDGRPDTRHDYLHVIMPNPHADADRIDSDAMAYRSLYIALADKEIVATGGYRSMPTIVSRFEKSPTETYGRSPGINVLPAIRAAQQIMRDIMIATELACAPPLLATDDAQDMLVRYAPRGITYGGLDDRGNKTLQPLFDGADIQSPMALQARIGQIIDRAFYGDLFLVNQEMKSHVSATDILERTQEKGVLLAPLARQETEWFAPMSDREIDLMGELGMLDDMPPEVIEAGGAFQCRFENPLARQQKSEQAAGFFRMLEQLTPLAQVKPGLLDDFLKLYPSAKWMPSLGYINAVPASWEASDEEVRAADEAQAQAEQAQQLLAAAPQLAKASKDLSQAGQMGGGDVGF